MFYKHVRDRAQRKHVERGGPLKKKPASDWRSFSLPIRFLPCHISELVTARGFKSNQFNFVFTAPYHNKVKEPEKRVGVGMSGSRAGI